MLGRPCPTCGRCPTCGQFQFDWMEPFPPLAPPSNDPGGFTVDLSPEFGGPPTIHDGHGDDGSLLAGP